MSPYQKSVKKNLKLLKYFDVKEIFLNEDTLQMGLQFINFNID